MDDQDEFSAWFDSFEDEEDFISEDDFQKIKDVQSAIYRNIDKAINGQARAERKITKFRKTLIAGGIAASIMLMIVFSLQKSNKVSYHQYVSGMGQIKTFILPDGSKAVLNGNSKLVFTQKEGGRELWLEGQAVFSVIHTQDHSPFVVHLTDTTSIKVLGTTFCVTNRLEDHEIVLKEGRVAFQLPSSTMTMKPNERIWYRSETKSYGQKQLDSTSKYFDWSDLRYRLYDTSLGEISEYLKSTYGLDIRIKNTILLRRSASGTLPLNLPKEQMVSNVVELYDLQFKWQNDTLVLSSRQ